MQEPGDIELVREYARSGSEEAFATLVSRHINLVYAAAMRQVGNSHQAEEIAQAVFTILAKKAGSLGKGTILSGWLFHTTRLTAANHRRGEIRRACREQEAFMQSAGNEGTADIWQAVAPWLDTAIAELGEKDRNAVVMRYIEGKNLAEVGVALGATEAAAQKRVNRAVEKLRAFFTKRGVVLTGTVLMGLVAANSAPAAPTGLAASVKAVAVMKGATASASTLALIKGTLKFMAWSKIKFAVGAGVAALLLAGGGIALSRAAGGSSREAEDIAKKMLEKYASLTSYKDTGTMVHDVDGKKTTTTFSTQLGKPDYYKVEWNYDAVTYTNKGAVWSAGEGDFVQTRGQQIKMNNANVALQTASSMSSGLTMTIPETFLGPPANGFNILVKRGQAFAREKDEKVGEVDCYVVTFDIPAPKSFANNITRIGNRTNSVVTNKQSYPAQPIIWDHEGTISIGTGSNDVVRRISPSGTVSTNRVISIAADPKSVIVQGSAVTLWIGKEDYLVHRWRQVVGGGKSAAKSKPLPAWVPKNSLYEITYENIILDEPVTKADFVYP